MLFDRTNGLRVLECSRLGTNGISIFDSVIVASRSIAHGNYFLKNCSPTLLCDFVQMPLIVRRYDVTSIHCVILILVLTLNLLAVFDVLLPSVVVAAVQFPARWCV